MRSLGSKIRRFMISDDGPIAVEYVVMLSLIIMVCLMAIRSIGTPTNNTFTNMSNSMGAT